MRLVYSRRASEDLIRLVDFLIDTDPAAASETVALIEDAVMVLQRHPMIGRKLDERMRELVISRGKSGYVALYTLLPQTDTVLLLSIRHQREAGGG